MLFRSDDAIYYLKKVLEINPESEMGIYELAFCYEINKLLIDNNGNNEALKLLKSLLVEKYSSLIKNYKTYHIFRN